VQVGDAGSFPVNLNLGRAIDHDLEEALAPVWITAARYIGSALESLSV
jgi:hypothetical protein